MITEKSTEVLILEAAREVFIHKGFMGARMQEIANKAGINKALLHYYFRSKDQLFEAVFNQALYTFFPVVKNILEMEKPFREKIMLFVETYVDTLLANPHIPAFVIQELNTNPTRLVLRMSDFGFDPNVIIQQIRREVDAGLLKPANPQHLMVNILGMCIFPFVAKPIIRGILKKSEDEYNRFLMERKKEIVHFVMQSI
jgi:AcrR family transcriptional regulator